VKKNETRLNGAGDEAKVKLQKGRTVYWGVQKKGGRKSRKKNKNKKRKGGIKPFDY